MWQQNTTLSRLSLEHNSIGPDGATALAQALQVNRSITTFTIHDNPLGNGGMYVIAEMMNMTLTCVQLTNSTCAV